MMEFAQIILRKVNSGITIALKQKLFLTLPGLCPTGDRRIDGFFFFCSEKQNKAERKTQSAS